MKSSFFSDRAGSTRRIIRAAEGVLSCRPALLYASCSLDIGKPMTLSCYLGLGLFNALEAPEINLIGRW